MKQQKQALEIAIEALRNTPLVGDRYDQQHSDTHTRAILVAQKALAERCTSCDDTGHVHDQVGEWRGVCSCHEGDVIRANAAPGPERETPPSNGEQPGSTPEARKRPMIEIIEALNTLTLPGAVALVGTALAVVWFLK